MAVGVDDVGGSSVDDNARDVDAPVVDGRVVGTGRVGTQNSELSLSESLMTADRVGNERGVDSTPENDALVGSGRVETNPLPSSLSLFSESLMATHRGFAGPWNRIGRVPEPLVLEDGATSPTY